MTLLAPYRVLDLTDERGHLAGLILAQLGADVIAVEPPGGNRARRQPPFDGDIGDPERSLSHWSFNRGKRSVVLDLAASAEDRATLRRLVAGADILIESGRPGELAALGLGYDDLAEVNPALVMASISAFGQTGPKAGYAESDLVVLAAGGYVSITGDDDRPPVRLSLPQAYHHAAADAAGAALIALWERQRSGHGQYIDVSAQASVLQCTQSTVLAAPYGAPIVARIAGGLRMPPLDLRLVWPCRDGYVTVAFLFGSSIGPFTARLMRWVHEAGFIDDATLAKDWIGFSSQIDSGEETVEEYERIKAALYSFLQTRTKAELLEGALERKLLIAPITTIADVVGSPQLSSRDYWQDVDVPQAAGPGGGRVRFPGSIVSASATPLRPLGPPPRLGQHTAEVLAEPVRAPAVPGRTSPALPGELPLQGVKVLDLMWAMPGPGATRVLADYGATVVRVESQHKVEVARTVQPFVGGQPGPENGGLFLNMNTNKLGLALDLNRPGARDIVLDLVRWADVVCEAFSPRAMRSWGLSYDELRAVNPDVIMLSSCLMGQTGPLAHFAGFGNLAAAISGFHNITGWPDRAPSGPFSAYTDYVSPRFTVAVLLAALDHRRRTGEGQYLDFSQAEASLHLLGPALLDFIRNGRVLERNGNRDPAMAPHGVFPCRGHDRWVAVAVDSDQAWHALCDEVGREDLARLRTAERLARVDELEAVVAGWTRHLDEDEAERRLQARGIPAHVVANSPESWRDPQLAHRGHFVTTDHALHGPLVVEGSRWRFSRTQPTSYRAAPTLGQDGFEVLHGLLGYDVDRIADLAAAELLE